jgi:hypothetical protein
LQADSIITGLKQILKNIASAPTTGASIHSFLLREYVDMQKQKDTIKV